MEQRHIGGYNPIPAPLKLFMRFLSMISTRLTLRILAFIFTRPIRYKTPTREMQLVEICEQSKLEVPKTGKVLQVYRLPNNGKKILFMHGWNGRGSQFYHLALELHNKGYDITTFDLPGHGKSSSNWTNIPDISFSVEALMESLGPFDCLISHSMGNIYALNAANTQRDIPAIITFCHPSMSMRPFFTGYIRMFDLPPEKYTDRLLDYYKETLGHPVSDFDPSRFVGDLKVRALIIHCEDDKLVDTRASHELHDAIDNSRIVITKGLGHFRILSDDNVTEEISDFMASLEPPS